MTESTPRNARPVAHRGPDVPGPGEPAVRLSGVTKRFPARRSWSEMLRDPLGGDEITVLDDVDLDVAPGEFFGLLGPNGAGKTTLFRILATLIIPDEGTVEVRGHDVTGDDVAVRELVGPVIGNERSLYWRLSASENLRLFASLHGLDVGEGRSRTRELLDLVGLSDTGNKIVGEFSSGMKQRLLLARALIPKPRVLLLDEPTRSLDPLAARAFRRFLRTEMSERLGCTVLLATHDTEEAAELCDRIGMLHRGRLLAVGTVDELGRVLSGHHYRVWARNLDDDRLRWLEEEGVISSHRVESRGAEGWTEVLLEIPGEMGEASGVLSSLTLGGAEVARFERVAVSLTDVMERVLAGGETVEGGEGGERRSRPGSGSDGRDGLGQVEEL